MAALNLLPNGAPAGPSTQTSATRNTTPSPPTVASEPGRQVVELARQGDLDAFDDLLRCYQARSLALATRLLSEREQALDVTQEAFLRLWKSRKRLDAESSTWPYLRQIIVNACRDHWRRSARLVTSDLEEHPEPIARDPAPDHRALASEAGAILQRCLVQLPTRERAAIVLRDVEGLETKHVARLLGTTATTVRTQISRGRVRLRELMDARSRSTSTPVPDPRGGSKP